MRLMLILAAALSSAGATVAHEVQPTIADLSVTDGALRIEMVLNAEAFVAGIDLDGLTDTNEASENDIYDRLRALPSQAMTQEFRAFAETWIARIGVTADGAPVPLTVERIEVPETGNVDLPRQSVLVLGGAVPVGAAALDIAWPDGAGDIVLRQQGVADPFTGLIAGGASSGPVPLAGGAARGGWQTFVDYIPVGFDHILPKGLDHILFVLGLFFLSTRLRPLIWQVSAFTLAHTVTLALGALGYVNIPGSIVEPLIAASIVYVAVENLFSDGLSRWRPLVIFGFGLLHGLGFASVLGEFG
ncbi:MAG: HupE/UreJ family protein, partial [Proteobacteria bacterium]|nr:HupE/UreJ family protein [Pseudomonadota bacterium]